MKILDRELKKVFVKLEELTSLVQAWIDATEDRVAGEPTEITLEQVRALLAEKSQEGFTAEVRGLLKKYGAPKLSQIDPANYAALMADAEELK